MSRKSVRTSETHPILVDFLPDEVVGTRGRLGMTFAPGMKAPSLGGDWERHLATDLKSLEDEHGIGVLVSLMEEHEYRGYGIPELYERDEFGGIGVRRFAIRDMGIPKEAESRGFEAMVRKVIENLEGGRNVAVHCRGGLGRTGTVAACILVALGGHAAEEAIGAVRAVRKGAVQTREQEDFVRRFEESTPRLVERPQAKPCPQHKHLLSLAYLPHARGGNSDERLRVKAYPTRSERDTSMFYLRRYPTPASPPAKHFIDPYLSCYRQDLATGLAACRGSVTRPLIHLRVALYGNGVVALSAGLLI